jgi:hypothetical protein
MMMNMNRSQSIDFSLELIGKRCRKEERQSNQWVKAVDRVLRKVGWDLMDLTDTVFEEHHIFFGGSSILVIARRFQPVGISDQMDIGEQWRSPSRRSQSEAETSLSSLSQGLAPLFIDSPRNNSRDDKSFKSFKISPTKARKSGHFLTEIVQSSKLFLISHELEI